MSKIVIVYASLTGNTEEMAELIAEGIRSTGADGQGGKLASIPGTPPDLIRLPKGDAFALRSQYAMKIDYEQEPPLYRVSETHFVKSWLMHPYAPTVTPPEAIVRKQRLLEGVYDQPVLVAELN